MATTVLPSNLQIARQEMSLRLLQVLLSFYAISALLMFGTGIFLGISKVIILSSINLGVATAAYSLQLRNKLQAASVVVCYFIMLTGIYSTWDSPLGIEDSSVILFVAAIVLASMLLRTFYLRILMIVGCTGAILVGLRVQLGLVPPEAYAQAPSQDTVLLITTMFMVTMGLRRINNDLWLTLHRAIKHEQSLTAANAALVTQSQLAQDAEQRWRALVDAAPNYVLHLDIEGRILFANRDGLVPGRLEGQLVNNIVLPASLPALTQALDQTVHQNLSSQVEVECQNQGRPRTYMFTLGPFARDGLTIGTIILVTDLTDRLRLREQLLISQKLDSLGRLAGGIAHDFNNLLTVINGHAELAENKLAENTGENVKEDIIIIRKTGERAASLTRQILTFGRKQTMQLRPIDLVEGLREMNSLLSRLIGEDIHFSVDVGPETPPILADRSQLEQVITNLVLNARDAIHAHPEAQSRKIRLSTRIFQVDSVMIDAFPGLQTGEHVELSVSDTGTGMSPEVQERLFEPFFTTKKAGEGTGLGLSTVYGIVHQSHGAIRIYSETGLGTSVKIYWPIATEKDRTPAPTTRQAGQSRIFGTENVLLVEDDLPVLRLAHNALRDMGYRVSEATSGEEALAILATDQKFDIVVTDVVMPGINGFQLSSRVPEGMPVLLTSGYAEEAWSSSSQEIPLDNFLLKPYGPAQLGAAIRRVLDQQA